MKKYNLISAALFLSISFIFYSCESNDMTTGPVIPINTGITLLVPPDNGVVSNLNPTFSWTSVSSAERYRFQLATDNMFVNIVLDRPDLTSSSYTITEAILTDSSTYYWRVNGYNSTDTTEWTPVSNFTTNTVLPTPNGKVLIELFTNTSCIPCVPANQYLDNIFFLQGVTNNDANVEIIRVHTTLFAGDPFYLFNPEVNNARQTYYNAANSNPRGYLLGAFMGAFNSSNWTSLINGKLGTANDYAFTIGHNYNSASNTGTLNVQAFQLSGATINDLRLFVAVIENELYYNAPNGETEFDNTLRDMLTSPNGDAISLSSGQSVSRTFNYNLRAGINSNHAQLVIFLQNYANREVFAVETIDVN